MDNFRLYMKYLVSSYTKFIMCYTEPYVVYFLHTSTKK